MAEKFGAAEQLTILQLFIAAQFDQTTGAFQAMHLPTWLTALGHCKHMHAAKPRDERSVESSIADREW